MMSDWTFNDKLSKLEKQYGVGTSTNVPSSVLHFFLKENNANTERCIQALEKNEWIGPKRRRMSEATPTNIVNDYQANQQFLSGSQDSAEKFRQQLHNRPRSTLNPLPHGFHHQGDTGGIRNDHDYYGDVFTPHPPLLPSSSSPGSTGSDHMLTNWNPSHPSSSHHPHPPPSSNNLMPVQVPFDSSSSARHPGYTKQLSEADKEMILRRQRECTEQAKHLKESACAQLEDLKREISIKNDQLRNLKRENSTTQIPQEDDMEFVKIIINTLQMDINEEEEKRKKRDWTCLYCSYINSQILTACDSCAAPRPHPTRHGGGRGDGRGPSPVPMPRTHQSGYNYR